MRASSGRWPERSRQVVGITVAMVVVAVFWWWPGLVGRGSDIDVSVHVTGTFGVGQQSIERRLREEGWRIEWSQTAVSWCDLVESIGGSDRHAGAIVVWGPERDDCAPIEQLTADVIGAAGDRHLYVVATSNDQDSIGVALGARGATVIDASRLLGRRGSMQDCLWWEDCPASGLVETRGPDGLTAVGFERVARMIVAEVR
jgi:hypothetical protein